MFTETQLRRMADSPAQCNYCDHVAPSHTARVKHEGVEHPAAMRGKKAAKRERERCAAEKKR